MTKTKLIIPAFALAAMASAVAFTTTDAQAKEGMEKCYGVAKAGANDCGSATGTHSCAGQTASDNMWEEWKYVETGTCEDAGGHLEAQNPADDHDHDHDADHEEK